MGHRSSVEGAEALRGFTIEKVLSSDEKTKTMSILGRSVNDGFRMKMDCR